MRAFGFLAIGAFLAFLAAAGAMEEGQVHMGWKMPQMGDAGAMDASPDNANAAENDMTLREEKADLEEKLEGFKERLATVNQRIAELDAPPQDDDQETAFLGETVNDNESDDPDDQGEQQQSPAAESSDPENAQEQGAQDQDNQDQGAQATSRRLLQTISATCATHARTGLCDQFSHTPIPTHSHATACSTACGRGSNLHPVLAKMDSQGKLRFPVCADWQCHGKKCASEAAAAVPEFGSTKNAQRAALKKMNWYYMDYSVRPLSPQHLLSKKLRILSLTTALLRLAAPTAEPVMRFARSRLVMLGSRGVPMLAMQTL